jgi:hypothetical protein
MNPRSKGFTASAFCVGTHACAAPDAFWPANCFNCDREEIMSETVRSTERTVSALLFELRGDDYRSVAVWLGVTPYGVCLIDSQHSWLTTRAGDAIVVNGKRETVAAVELYSVSPLSQCDRVVTCAADWIAGNC